MSMETNQNFNKELQKIINSPSNEVLFSQKPSLKNYLITMQKFYISYVNIADQYMKFNQSFNNYVDDISDSIDTLKYKIIFEELNRFNTNFHNLNVLIDDFNKYIPEFNNDFNSYQNFSQLRQDDILYYIDYFNIDSSIIEIAVSETYKVAKIFSEINACIFELNTYLTEFSENMDVYLINHHDASHFPADNGVLPLINYFHIDKTSSADDELENSGFNNIIDENQSDIFGQIKGVNTIKSNPALDNNININKDSEETISTLPGFNLILAKKVVKARDEGFIFSSVDDLANLLSLKEYTIRGLEGRVSFDNGNNRNRKGRKLEFTDTPNSKICLNCNSENELSNNTCVHCGAEFPHVFSDDSSTFDAKNGYKSRKLDI